MKCLKAITLLALVLFFGAPAAWAGGAGEEELDPVHHVADGYYLDFAPLGKVELPRIFLVRGADGSLGFDAFWTTEAALRSGEFVVEDLEVGPAEQLSAELEGEAIAAEGHQTLEELLASGLYLDAHLVPAGGGEVLIDLSITRHLVFAILGALIVFFIFTTLARRYQRGIGRETAPRGVFQNLFETLVVFVRDEIARPNLGHKYKKFLPFLLTAFFFILTCNLLGLVPYGATATSNIMITSVLAAFTFVLTQVHGSKDYWKHVFWPPGVPVPIKPILIPVEFMGLFTKPIALAIRLFANMTAGHLVILSLLGLIFAFGNLFGPGAGYGVSPVSVLFTLFIYLLELLVAFIQAYIFTMLSALFIGMAVEEHHHEAPEEGHLPARSEDHTRMTPHPIMGDGATEVEQRTRVQAPTPA